jgi:DNA replication protein DnaC
MATPQASSRIERLEPHLSYLRLPELHETLGAHLQWAEQHPGASLQLLERVFADLASRKREHRIERRIKGSGLKDRKTLEAFDWAFQPKLSRPAIEELATLAFIDQREDVLITGKAGTGKSHILKALVMRACHQERMVRYARAVDLIEDLYAGLADDTYTQRLKRWCRPDFLVIDDIRIDINGPSYRQHLAKQRAKAKRKKSPRSLLRPQHPAHTTRLHGHRHTPSVAPTSPPHRNLRWIYQTAGNGSRLDRRRGTRGRPGATLPKPGERPRPGPLRGPGPTPSRS